MHVIHATWGEDLLLRVRRWEKAERERRGIRQGLQTELFEAIGPFADCVPNTLRALLNEEDVPTSRKARRRAWMLLTAIGEDPIELGIDDSVIAAHEDKAKLVRDLRSSLLYAPRDSNPEPSD